MKILLTNDTGLQRHVGCIGVSYAHVRVFGERNHIITDRIFTHELGRYKPLGFGARKHLERDAELMGRLDAVDAVVVNGEGTIHHGRGEHLLALLDHAKERKRHAFLINASLQDLKCDPAVLNRFDAVIVRETRSKLYCDSLGVKCLLNPDSIVYAEFELPPESRANDRQEELVTDWHKSRDLDVGMICTERLKLTNSRFFPLQRLDAHRVWRNFQVEFAKSAHITTGRYHGVYLSILSQTPFTALESNSWKISGLAAMLNEGFTPCQTGKEVEASRANVGLNSDRPRRLWEKLAELSERNAFDLFGARVTGGTVSENLKRFEKQVSSFSRVQTALPILTQRAREAAISSLVAAQDTNCNFKYKLARTIHKLL